MVCAVAVTAIGISRLLGQAYTFSQYSGTALGPSPSSNGGLIASRFVFDQANNIYLGDLNNNVIRKISPTGAMSLFAGSTQGNVDGVGSVVRFSRPIVAKIDGSGNLLVYDGGAGTLRQIDVTGLVTTVQQVRAPVPYGSPFVTSDSAGNLYVGDYYFSQAYKITPSGVVSPMPATGSVNFGTYVYAIAADNAGNVYCAVSDHTIRRIGADNTVSIWAGTSQVRGSTDGPRTSALFSRPGSMVFDASGNLYVSDLDNYTLRRISPTGTVTTVAGTVGVPGSADGIGASARLGDTWALSLHPSGAIYMLDETTGAIRTFSPATGAVSTLVSGLNPGDGPIATAMFSYPLHLGSDSAGNLYVAEGSFLRKISPDGLVSTLHGPTPSFGLFPVIGIPGTPDTQNIGGIAPDETGGAYITDYDANVVQRVDAHGVLSVLAGTSGVAGMANGLGTAAQFNRPTGIARDSNGNLYVADNGNYAVRKITPDGAVSLFAGLMGVSGTSDGTGIAARFTSPGSIAADRSGNLYVADKFAIRKITANGTVTTLAGVVTQGGSVDGVGTSARLGGTDYYFSGISDIAVDAGGNVFVADHGNYTVRKITPLGVVTTIGGVAGTSASATGTGSAARFMGPSGIAVDPSGNVFVTQNTSGDFTIRKGVPTASAPTFTFVPATQSVPVGSTVVLAADAIAAATYQWFRNGAAISGATNRSFSITGAAAGHSGAYTVVATNAVGATTSTAAALSVVATNRPGRLLNVSVLAPTSASQALAVGFVTGGAGTSGNQSLLIRGLGPALVPFNVPGWLTDPSVEVYRQADGTPITANDNWAGNSAVAAANAAFTGLPLVDAASADAATVATLPAAGYSVRVPAKGTAVGQVLAEVYDATPNSTPSTPRLINLSTLNTIAMNGSLTAGFVIGGDTARTVLIRVSGPALTSFGVTGVMPDPTLTLYKQQQVLLRNAGWAGDPLVKSVADAVKAFTIVNTASHDAALVVTLPAGSYSVEATSVSGSPGAAIVEVYEVP